MRRLLLGVLLCVVAIIILVVPVLYLYLLYLGNYVNPQTVEERNELIRTQLQALGLVAQVIGGLLVLGSLRVAWNTFIATREAQITERFTRAIDQIGATDAQGNNRREIRMGGIYALARIARDSPKDYETILEILTAYIRENARVPDHENGPPANEPSTRTPTDIQTVLNVLKQLIPYPTRTITVLRGVQQPPAEFKARLDLSRSDLRRAHFTEANANEANLRSCWFEYATLHHTILTAARLEEAYLKEVGLQHADLTGAHLDNAHLEGAFLEHAVLKEADLRRADLRGVHLTGADLQDAQLAGTMLQGVDLREVKNLTRSQLQHAYYEGAQLPSYLDAS